MEIKYHKNFIKNYRKRIFPNKKLDLLFEKRVTMFQKDPNNFVLKDHKLMGEMKEFRSFSLTGDVRVIYLKTNTEITLYDIGSHNQVY